MTDRQTVSTADYQKLKRENEELKVHNFRIASQVQSLKRYESASNVLFGALVALCIIITLYFIFHT